MIETYPFFLSNSKVVDILCQSIGNHATTDIYLPTFEPNSPDFHPKTERERKRYGEKKVINFIKPLSLSGKRIKD